MSIFDRVSWAFRSSFQLDFQLIFLWYLHLDWALGVFNFPSKCLGFNTGNMTDAKRHRLGLSVLSLGIWKRSQHCRGPQVENKLLLLQTRCSFHRSEAHEDYAWAHVTTARHDTHATREGFFLQDFLCFHSFHLQSSFLPWSISGQPEIQHAISVSQIEPGVSWPYFWYDLWNGTACTYIFPPDQAIWASKSSSRAANSWDVVMFSWWCVGSFTDHMDICS